METETLEELFEKERNRRVEITIRFFALCAALFVLLVVAICRIQFLEKKLQWYYMDSIHCIVHEDTGKTELTLPENYHLETDKDQIVWLVENYPSKE